MTDDNYDVTRFALAFQRFLEDVHRAVPPSGATVRDEVAAHVGADPSALPSVAESVHPAEHPNLQLALDDLTAGPPPGRVIGLPLELRHWGEVSLGSILAGRFRGPVEVVPPEYRNVAVDVDRSLPCVQLGLWLLHDEDGSPVVVLVLVGGRHTSQEGLTLEVAAADATVAAGFVARVRRRMLEANVYRGKVLGFSFSQWGEFDVHFHRVPAIGRDDIVLPAADLDAIERHTVGIARHAGALRAAGRHLKRGLLLYGPPGTGKTYSVMYLCNLMPDRTVLLLSGVGSQVLGQATALARALAPSMVVLEDVDLVAAERTNYEFGSNPLLFQLLNEMDGLAEDADVVFVLTTNRVELLEPALANRPGRIDEAVEVKLPDAECRRRLFELYLRGIDTEGVDLDPLVARTEGVSAAFVKELVRRAALEAAEAAGDGGALVATGAGLERALDALLDRRTSVLGATLGLAADLE